MKRTVFAYPDIVWMLIFILAPMLLIIWYAFSKDGSFTLANLTTALTDPIYMQVLLRSVWIAFKATVICLLLGYPIAWFLSTMRKSTAAILYILFIVPMWMNFLLRTYAWQAILDSAGILNVILEFFGLPPQHLLYTEGAIMPVSYTHLAVYKRKGANLPGKGNCSQQGGMGGQRHVRKGGGDA